MAESRCDQGAYPPTRPLSGVHDRLGLRDVGRIDLADELEYATPEARLDKLDQVFRLIEEWTQQYPKLQAMELLNDIEGYQCALRAASGYQRRD